MSDDFDEAKFNDYMKRNFPGFVPAEPSEPTPSTTPARPNLHQGARQPAGDADDHAVDEYLRRNFPALRD